jgi:hypothetical protein
MWAGGLSLAAYTLLTGVLWAVRERLGTFARPLGLPAAGFALRGRPWLTAGGLASSAVVVALAIWSDFAFPEPLARYELALAAIASAGPLAMLARGDRSPTLRRATIEIGLLGAVVLGWAAIRWAPGNYPLQHAATAAAITAFAAMGALLVGRRIPQFDGGWSHALRQLTPVLIVAALGSIAGALGFEVAAQLKLGRVPMHPLAVAAMLVTLLAGAATAIALALSARPDPLGLPDRGREAYAYAAEALLACAVVHLRLTVPHLFGGPLRHYWPVIVMLVAFAGVASGEALRRRGRLVLGRPLASTGVLLPVLPVVAFWFAASRVHYSALLALAGLLYGMVAVVRGSLRFGLVAALAGNAALWYLLHQQESLGLLVHPQLWIIPAALSLLAAGELNRSRLSADQLRGFRYASLAAVYVSSTADIFLAGVGHSPWLPLVLAGLSVAGVMAGLSLRVRPFLFLGTGFLTLAIVAMIWNAAVNLHWTWLWYVAGIVLGLMILTLFALFEKKREEMLALVEGLRGWE